MQLSIFEFNNVSLLDNAMKQLVGSFSSSKSSSLLLLSISSLVTYIFFFFFFLYLSLLREGHFDMSRLSIFETHYPQLFWLLPSLFLILLFLLKKRLNFPMSKAISLSSSSSFSFEAWKQYLSSFCLHPHLSSE